MRNLSETVSHEAFVGGAKNSRGNVADSWDAPTDVWIYAFNPGVTEAPLVPGHDRTETRPTIYAPIGTIMTHRDRVTRRGRVYEVDGETLIFESPFDSSMDGVRIPLKEVAG